MNTLKYKSILVVTYGRSGSTLLQGILNSINDVLVRGENSDFCWGLYTSWKSLLSSRKHANRSAEASAPWYGARFLDPDSFLKSASELIAEQILTNHHKEICYGFKEIRYLFHLDELFNYLNFLEKIFPDPVFVFNTRSHEDVINSALWNTFDREELTKSLLRADSLFYNFCAKKSNSFLMRYENLIKGPRALKPLFDFLGAEMDVEKVSTLLEKSHSYDQKPETLRAAKWIRAKRASTLVLETPLPDELEIDEFSSLSSLRGSTVVCSIVKDELYRLPWFLTYYRRLGCQSFLLIDNGSTDGTVEFLRAQPDVMLFNTEPESFRNSKSGRIWVNFLTQKYAVGKWVLCADADELLCWPNHHFQGLAGLSALAERMGLNRIFTPLVDAYSDKPTNEMTAYTPGSPFGESCKWIDPIETLKHQWNQGRLLLFGGPRSRLTRPGEKPPMMTKQSFYFVEPDGFKHLNAHFDNYGSPSPLVAPLLHYRFMPDFSERCGKYIAEGTQWQNAKDYKNYMALGLGSTHLKMPNSIQINSGQDLLPYIQTISRLIRERGLTGSDHFKKKFP